MRYRIRYICAKRICFGKVLTIINDSPHILQGFACLSVFHQFLTGSAAGLSCDQCLPGTGCGSGIRRNPGIASFVYNVFVCQICTGNYHLHQHRSQPLSDAGSSGINVKFLIFFYNQFYSSGIRDSYSHTCIFHGTADSYRSSLCHGFIKLFSDCLKSLHQTCRFVYNLSVRKDFSRANGIPVTDFPWCDSCLVCHHIQKSFCSKTSLCHTKSPESSCRWIIGIISSAFDFKILIMIRSCRMGTGTFQYRPSQRRESSCV